MDVMSPEEAERVTREEELRQSAQLVVRARIAQLEADWGEMSERAERAETLLSAITGATRLELARAAFDEGFDCGRTHVSTRSVNGNNARDAAFERFMAERAELMR